MVFVGLHERVPRLMDRHSSGCLPMENFPHALWVDFQTKSYALLCSAVARDESTKPHTLKEFPTVSCLFPFLRRVVGVPPAGSEIYRNIEDDCGYQTSDETRRCLTNDTGCASNDVRQGVHARKVMESYQT